MLFENTNLFTWGPIVWTLAVIILYQTFAYLVVYQTEPPFFIRKAQKQLEKRLKHGPNRLRVALTGFGVALLIYVGYTLAGPLLQGVAVVPILGSIVAGSVFSVFIWTSVSEVFYRLSPVFVGLIAVAAGAVFGVGPIIGAPVWYMESLHACFICLPILYLCKGIKVQPLVGLMLALIINDVIRSEGTPTSVLLSGISIYNLPVPMTLDPHAQPLFHISWATLLMGALINLVGMRATERQGSMLYTAYTASGTGLGFIVALAANMYWKVSLPASLFVVGGAGAGYLYGHTMAHMVQALENLLGRKEREDHIILVPKHRDDFYLTRRYLEERRRSHG